MRNSSGKQIYDTLIVGGGPAGLAAAVYLGRALRTAVVFDAERPGRSDWVQHNFNYLGFPDGIAVRELVRNGREQATRYGIKFVDSRISAIQAVENDLFRAKSGGREYTGRSVILATGVTDRWVEFPGYEDCIGRSMHWCLVCDGFEMQGKRVLVVGNSDDAAETAVQLTHFTTDVSLLVEKDLKTISAKLMKRVGNLEISVYYGQIDSATCRERGEITSVLTDQGERIFADHLFSALGAVPNSELATELGLKLDAEGHVVVDSEARTSVPWVFAAGDVTRLFSHQVLTAAHEGSTAAMAIAHDLFEEDLRQKEVT